DPAEPASNSISVQSPMPQEGPEFAQRIAVVDSHWGRRLSGPEREFLQFLTCFLGEPYEWGGAWFGGRISGAGKFVGGGEGDDGYGIDCSGLMYSGAMLAGYRWGRGKPGTSMLVTSRYTRHLKPDGSDLVPGDILVRTRGTRVVHGKRHSVF